LNSEMKWFIRFDPSKEEPLQASDSTRDRLGDLHDTTEL
jgi:hypothetical protein